MKWIYFNNSKRIVFFKNFSWLPNEQHEVSFPVPDSLGLTCIQQGSIPDPVLFHDDILIAAGTSATVDIPAPVLTQNISLNIQCMIQNSGVECRFNHQDNTPIPIDARAFSQCIDWSLCSKIFLNNPTDVETIISVTAIETGV